MPIQLIVGLGNPGQAYEHTRHNVGAVLVSHLAQRLHLSFKNESKFKAFTASTQASGATLRLLIPQTFMNLSGQAVRAVAQFYNIPVTDILIVHDDLDLPAGRVKLKTGGGHAGHNGLKDIITQLGSPEFHRLRLGIGHPGHRDLVHDYVLGKPNASDKTLIFDAIERALNIVPDLRQGLITQAMTQIN